MPSNKKNTGGAYVNYRTSTGKWVPAAIISITDATHLVLAIPRNRQDATWAQSPLSAAGGVNAQMTQVNGGAAVTMQVQGPTGHNSTNVYTRYRGS
jgi:hypothetical protein